MSSKNQKNVVLKYSTVHWHNIKNSIVTRIILFILMAIMIGGAIRYYLSAKIIHDNLYKVVSIHQEALAKEVAKSITYDLELRKKVLSQMVSKMPSSLLNNPQKLKQWLMERDELNTLFSAGLLVLNREGNVVLGIENEVDQTIQFSQYDFFEEATSQAFAIGTPLLSKVLHEPILPMALSIKDEAGDVKAVIVGLTYLFHAGFLEHVLNGHIGDTGDFLVIDAKKEIFIAATKKELILQPTPKKGVNALHDKAMAGFRGSGITRSSKGEDELSAIESIPNTNWFVVSRILTKEAFVMEENIKMAVIRGHIISLIIVPFFIFTFFFLILKPLRTTAFLADEMSLGKRPLKELPIQKMDEVGYLTAAFNRLITKVLESQKALREMAHYDYLTKLPNRFLMVDRLEQALLKCKRNNHRIALLFMDLDGFKNVNDTLGHNAGDDALIEVSQRFASLIRQGDTLSRVGGDEFVILLTELDGDMACAMQSAYVVAKKCEEALQEPLFLQGTSWHIGVSVGIAIGDKESVLDELMAEADTKMYEKKHRKLSA